MVLLAKTLSGGHVPVAAVLARKKIFDKVFDRMERAVAPQPSLNFIGNKQSSVAPAKISSA